MTARAPFLAALLAMACGAVVGEDRPFVDEPSHERRHLDQGPSWAEEGFVLPPYPEEADLIGFPVDDPGSPLRYSLDARHLAVGDDGVVRYTLVVRSSSGAVNVSVEGIRCDQRQYKVYAYGTGDGTLRPIRDPQWEGIGSLGAGSHHRDLRQFYFCKPDRYSPYPKEEIVRLLSEGPRRIDDPGFY
jgi:hypothetical protein